jgi:hypothetical protein
MFYDKNSMFNSSDAPLGEDRFNIQEVAIAAEFPKFFEVVFVGTMNSKSLSVTGAIFLLMMLSKFPQYITREMWAGSSTQLNASKLHSNTGGFLQSFQNWNVEDNKFKWLCQTSDEFDRHFAIQCRLKNPDKKIGVLQSLYEGGLCKVARLHTDSGTTPEELVQQISGKLTLHYADCDAQKTMRAASTVTNVIGAGATGLGVVQFIAGSLIAGPISMAATLGITAATIAGSYFMGKNTYDTTICIPPDGALMIDETRFSYDNLNCD